MSAENMRLPLDESTPPEGALRVRVTLDIRVENRLAVSADIRVDAQPGAEAALAAAVSAAVTGAIQASLSPASAPARSEPDVSIQAESSRVAAGTGDTPLGTRHARPLNAWTGRYRKAISAGLGGLFVLLAILVPLIAPPEQRSQVLVMSVLFGLTGALLLFSAVDVVDAGKWVAPAPPQPVRRRHSANGAALVSRKAVLLSGQARPSRARAIGGMVFGALFALAGVLAPFVLIEGAENPDARFLMMLGFAPVAISGLVLMQVFGRALNLWGPTPARQRAAAPLAHSPLRLDSIAATLAMVGVLSGLVLTGCAVVLPFVVSGVMRPSAVAASPWLGGIGVTLSLLGGWYIRRERVVSPTILPVHPARRAPVPRIPSSFLYKTLVPASIVLLLLLIVGVIAVVVAATVTPLVR